MTIFLNPTIHITGGLQDHFSIVLAILLSRETISEGFGKGSMILLQLPSFEGAKNLGGPKRPLFFVILVSNNIKL